MPPVVSQATPSYYSEGVASRDYNIIPPYALALLVNSAEYLSLQSKLQATLYPTPSEETSGFAIALDTTCKLHRQGAALEKLQSEESAVVAMKLFTEMNLKDSCNWVSSVSFFKFQNVSLQILLV